MNKKKVGIVIGRFQPFHNGHLQLLREAAENSDYVLVLVGSAAEAITPKNPWTASERRSVILEIVNSDDQLRDRVVVDSIRDFPYDLTRWVSGVRQTISQLLDDCEFTIFGYNKDQSSFYLSLFPDMGFHACKPYLVNGKPFGSTDVRRELFETGRFSPETAAQLPSETIEQLKWFMVSPRFIELRDEIRQAEAYRESWAGSPFPPVFVTTDAVVVQSGHVLLVERGRFPGKGLLALPGGFIDQTETIEDCAIRELIEETSIKLQPEVLSRCIKEVKVFDRSGHAADFERRGRIITHAHFFRLNDFKPLPPVKGASDAADALWVPIHAIDANPEVVYSDHYHIIKSFI